MTTLKQNQFGVFYNDESLWSSPAFIGTEEEVLNYWKDNISGNLNRLDFHIENHHGESMVIDSDSLIRESELYPI